MKMTKQTLDLYDALPLGITMDFETPCKGQKFSDESITDIFTTKLPEFLKELKEGWNATQCEQQTGLAMPSSQGPFDAAILKGEWNTEKFSHHGGKIPIMGGAPGSRGIPEKWPYKKSQWVQVGHEKWKRIEPNGTKSEEQSKEDPKTKQRLDWTGMD